MVIVLSLEIHNPHSIPSADGPRVSLHAPDSFSTSFTGVKKACLFKALHIQLYFISFSSTNPALFVY